MFGGPLTNKSEEVKCNYLMIRVGEKGCQIFSTWKLTADQKKELDIFHMGFEVYCKPRSNKIHARYKIKSRVQGDSEMF